MGIQATATVSEAVRRRRRRHRSDLLNDLETNIENQKENMTTSDDQSLWKQSTGKFRAVFTTKLTWVVGIDKEA